MPHLPGEEGGEEEGQHDGGDGVGQHEAEHWVAKSYASSHSFSYTYGTQIYYCVLTTVVFNKLLLFKYSFILFLRNMTVTIETSEVQKTKKTRHCSLICYFYLLIIWF